MEANPYTPPQADIIPPPPADAEGIRIEHLKTEGAIRTAGGIYLAAALLWGLAASFLVFDSDPETMGGGLFHWTLAAALSAVAIGLRRHRPWARGPGILVSILGLLAFPIGTLMCGLILAKIGSRKAATVMSPGYAPIIAATPHLKPRVHWPLIIVLVCAVVLVVLLALSIRIERR
jgi:hypothetical protein